MTTALVIVASLIMLLGAGVPATAAERQKLRGGMPAVAHLQRLRSLARTNRLEVAFGLPYRNREALTNLLQQLYDPSSPQYHQYLTPEQFSARFAPAAADYDAVIAYAHSNGLAVIGTSVNRTLLYVSAAVSDVERAFHVNIGVYQHPRQARTFHAPNTEPSVDLAVPLLSISGLDDMDLPHAMNMRLTGLGDAQAVTPYATGSGPRGNLLGRDFRSAYVPGVSLDGAGQAIGLFELDDFYASDITTYEDMAGLPRVPLQVIRVSNRPANVHGSGNVEVALDIEMAIAMAPGLSKIIVYEGLPLSGALYPNAVLNCMATNNQAKVLSCSWGFRTDASTAQIYQQFAAQGQTMFQSSGDDGAWGGCNPLQTPCDTPLATVVGGTSLTTSGPGGTWLSETVWPGSGGGISTNYPIPSWQRCADMSLNQGSTTYRNVPDVAAVADTTIWVVANHGEQMPIGGTSASAPLWAGIAAMANQQAALSGKPSLGLINPLLYTIPKAPGYGSAFHDITAGNTTNTCNASRFFAGPGYDLCTGWGTPAGGSLIQALVTPPDVLQVSPAETIVFSGPVGGPFSPAAQDFALTDGGSAPVDWSWAGGAAWLSLSPEAGTVPGCGGVNVAATLASSAASLSAGSYSAIVWFTNLTSDSVQSRAVVLNVVTPPLISAPPVSQAVLEGATVTFSVGVSNPASVTYRWQLNNDASVTNLADAANISGSATSTLTLRNVSTNDVGAYSVVVSNAAGATLSSSALLTIVPSLPVITSQPTNQTALRGATVTFAVEAVGSQPFGYLWRRNGMKLKDGGNISGSSTSTLTVRNLTEADAGGYAVRVSNSYGVVVTPRALLSLTPTLAPDILLDSVTSFSGGTEGSNPNGVVQGTNGNFYGTTQSGGTNSFGTVSRLAASGELTTLCAFSGSADGASPRAPLAQGVDGNFYGTTLQGGTSGAGTVFRVTPAGVLSNLHSFTGGADGSSPFGALARGDNGDFYGSAAQGGAYGYGTLFKVTAAGLFTTLYSFTGSKDGANPLGSLVLGNDGQFYGTTYRGGLYGLGTVFKMASGGALTIMTWLDYTNGGYPRSGVVQGSDGNLYGTAPYCGAYGFGTIFRVSPDGLLTNLHSFTGTNEGLFPFGALVESVNGNFYGTTAWGGAWNSGTAFRMAPNGTVATLVTFDGFDGAGPESPLIEAADGTFYGTTASGGPGGQGTIFRIGINSPPQITSQPVGQSVFSGVAVSFSVAASGTPPLRYQWRKDGTDLTGATERVLTFASITTADMGRYSALVSNVLGSTISADAALAVTSSPPIITSQPVGRTVAPGTSVTFSTEVTGSLPISFEWRKNGTDLADNAKVSGSATANLTLSSVVESDAGTYSLLLTNAFGAALSLDATLDVVPASAAGTRLYTLHWFTNGEDGGSPNGLVQAANGSLYGTTLLGGAHRAGTVFRVTPDGAFHTLLPFSWTNGALPAGALVQGTNGILYGTTQYGGSSESGTAFSMTPAGQLATLYSFSRGADGAEPYAALLPGADGNLYGSTQNGSTHDAGSIFRLDPTGTLTTLYAFANDADGGSPVAALVQGTDGNFYGTTPYGGTNGYGNVFRLTTDGKFTTLYSFLGDTYGSLPVGNHPVAALLQGADGLFYGTTMNSTLRGSPLSGTLFKITTNGVLTSLYALNSFVPTDGWFPEASLIQGRDGNFYGTTYGGGVNRYGTVFRLTPAGVVTTLVSFDGFDGGAHPVSALVDGSDGSLYGTTSDAGIGNYGTVFRLDFAPQLITQPTNHTVPAGADVVLAVSLFGSQPLFFQWRVNGTNLVDNANVTGSTTAVLQLHNVSLANSGTYSAVVTNALGSVTSGGSVLTVVSPPVFQTIYQTNGSLTITWSATPGQRYQLQGSSNLPSTNWLSLGNAVLATAPTITASDAIGPNTRRYYRVVLLP